MLREQSIEKLYSMKLRAMAEAFHQQLQHTDMNGLSFEERFGMLVDSQWQWRQNRSLAQRLKHAGLKQSAWMEDINYRHARQLDRSQMRQLAGGQWIELHQNILISGPTGIGKTYLCCALLEIIEDRHGNRSTVIASQFPLASWHELIGNPSMADNIMDRLTSDAHRLELQGESLRCKKAPASTANEEVGS